MAASLRLGRRNLGCTAPNPSVACLLVKNDIIVGAGVTAPGGRPHAEVVALSEAGENAKGSTVYVTLEPCAHHGKTPPCCDALIKAGVARVVVPALDPNPLTAGKSVARLKTTGIEVTQGVIAQEAARDHAGHILHILERRPFVQLKMALTANSMAGRKGERLMISGEEAHCFTQRLRTQADAILVGIGTVLADDPQLTCRLRGLENRSPKRFVFDRNLRMPEDSKFAQTAKEVPVIVFTTDVAPAQKRIALEKFGVQVRKIEADNFIAAALREMSEMGITRLLLEGGPSLAASFLEQDFVDQVLLAQSDKAYENKDAAAAFNPTHWQRLTNPAAFIMTEEVKLGQDTLKTYWRKRACLQG